MARRWIPWRAQPKSGPRPVDPCVGCVSVDDPQRSSEVDARTRHHLHPPRFRRPSAQRAPTAAVSDRPATLRRPRLHTRHRTPAGGYMCRSRRPWPFRRICTSSLVPNSPLDRLPAAGCPTHPVQPARSFRPGSKPRPIGAAQRPSCFTWNITPVVGADPLGRQAGLALPETAPAAAERHAAGHVVSHGRPPAGRRARPR